VDKSCNTAKNSARALNKKGLTIALSRIAIPLRSIAPAYANHYEGNPRANSEHNSPNALRNADIVK